MPARRPPASPARRAGSRPAPAARGRSARPVRDALAGASTTRRLAVLAGIGLVLAVVLAPYLRAWVEQRAELAALRQEVAEREERVQALEDERERWEDPAYVAAEARRRLRFVMPGETAYAVVTPEAPAPEEATEPEEVAALVTSEDRPWFGDVLESLRVADADVPAEAPTQVEPVPAPTATPSP